MNKKITLLIASCFMLISCNVLAGFMPGTESYDKEKEKQEKESAKACQKAYESVDNAKYGTPPSPVSPMKLFQVGKFPNSHDFCKFPCGLSEYASTVLNNGTTIYPLHFSEIGGQGCCSEYNDFLLSMTNNQLDFINFKIMNSGTTGCITTEIVYQTGDIFANTPTGTTFVGMSKRLYYLDNKSIKNFVQNDPENSYYHGINFKTCDIVGDNEVHTINGNKDNLYVMTKNKIYIIPMKLYDSSNSSEKIDQNQVKEINAGEDDYFGFTSEIDKKTDILYFIKKSGLFKYDGNKVTKCGSLSIIVLPNITDTDIHSGDTNLLNQSS